MKRVILDTNFLLAIGQFGIDVFSELERICDFPYKVFVLDKTIGELNKVLTTGGKDKAAAKLALSLVKEKVEVIKTSDGYVDDILVQLANEDNLVATQDKELKNRIKTRIITIKQKKYLAFGNV
ncbi:MAG: DNA-binding protein [Nanoarchaeota archaeon]|nr:DNA-binding protein [Nanoarchaeota archaeon]